MDNITVPGAAHTSQPLHPSPRLLALEIARALELEAYAAWRRAFHQHRRQNTADSAADVDASFRTLLDAQVARDNAETTHDA